MPEVVGVQFLKGGGILYFLAANNRLALDSLCVVEGDHGMQVVRVVRANRTVPDKVPPVNLKSVIRSANARDLEQLKKNEKKEQEAYRFCRQKVQEKTLQMKLVDVNYTLDGRKAVFYFTADNRVDFRELVKELAQSLKIKIEMRQIGVRDEARRLGGVGCCGRPLCCNSFLKDFASVSIRMAKEQNLSLNPTKVSGLCGRLMCCLAYEYDGTFQKGKRGKGDEKSGQRAVDKPVSVDDQAGCDNCQAACQAGPEHEAIEPAAAETGAKSVAPAKPAMEANRPQPSHPPQANQAARSDQDKNNRRRHFRKNRNKGFSKPPTTT